MKSMPLAVAVSGIKSRIIRSRTHAPVALKACLLLPLRRAIATILSVRPRRSSSPQDFHRSRDRERRQSRTVLRAPAEGDARALGYVHRCRAQAAAAVRQSGLSDDAGGDRATQGNDAGAEGEAFHH